MKVKVYKVRLRYKCQDDTTYFVDAPSKRIAKWCGANLFNHEFMSFCKAKDMRAVRFKLKGGD